MKNVNVFRVEEKSSVENGVRESKQQLVSEPLGRFTLWHEDECYGFVIGTYSLALQRAVAAGIPLEIRPAGL
jgi:hypothetical protein